MASLTTIRAAGPEDFGLLVRACLACREEDGGDDPQQVWQSVRDERMRFYVLERDGCAEAWVAALLDLPRATFGLFGRDASGGSLLTDAGRLWEYARKDLAARGITTVSAWVSDSLENAVSLRRFYERMGFYRTGVSLARGIGA